LGYLIAKGIHEMRIGALRRKKAKGLPAELADEALLIAGFGMKGDAGAGKATRHLSLLPSEAESAREAEGLCSSRFYANIEIAGSLGAELKRGQKMKIGEALIEIEEIGKPCYQDCPVFQRSGPCVLGRESLFAKVLVGGRLRVGQELEASHR
jgi:cyclic pyranopterin monophosphate synthase